MVQELFNVLCSGLWDFLGIVMGFDFVLFLVGWGILVFFFLIFKKFSTVTLYVSDILCPSQCDVIKYWVSSHIFVSWFICGRTMIPKEEVQDVQDVQGMQEFKGSW